MKNILKRHGIKVGRRLIMYRAGFTNSGKDGHVCIGIITTINEKEDNITVYQFGYDVKEEDYLQGFFIYGHYSLQDVVKIVKAQDLFEQQFQMVNINLNPIDFYQSEKNLSEITPNTK